MLNTPLGTIQLFVNDNEIPFTAIKLDKNERFCPNVKGRFLIQYAYKKEYGSQVIKCCILPPDIIGNIETGERLEAIAFYTNETKLTIAAEAEFEQSSTYDYSGRYFTNGLAYETSEKTNDCIFQFGVCWINPCTDANDHETWFGADPSLM